MWALDPRCAAGSFILVTAAPRAEAQSLGVQGAGGGQAKPSGAVLIRQHLTDLGAFVQPLKSSVSENLGCVTNTTYR